MYSMENNQKYTAGGQRAGLQGSQASNFESMQVHVAYSQAGNFSFNQIEIKGSAKAFKALLQQKVASVIFVVDLETTTT